MFNFFELFNKRSDKLELPPKMEGDFRMIVIITYTHYLPGAIECATLELLESIEGVRDVVIDTYGNASLREDYILSSAMWKMRVKPWLNGYISNKELKQGLNENEYIKFGKNSNVKDLFSELIRTLEREEKYEVASIIQTARREYDNCNSKV
jgi:hypothetical protein